MRYNDTTTIFAHIASMTNKRKFSLDEFMKSTEPAGRESRLLEFWDEIKLARRKKYSLSQICQWLEKNDHFVTVQGLSKFIKTQEEKESGNAGSGEDSAPKKVSGSPKPSAAPKPSAHTTRRARSSAKGL